jgi:acyl-CoA thioesterase I
LTQPLIDDGAVVLFQGDSVTDADRNREDPDDLGLGYPALVAAQFTARYPRRRVRWLNRGISGHRTGDLRARWEADCLDLHPTWVSILIGINDTWRRYDEHDPTPAEVYEANYRALLEPIRDRLGARLVLVEPFLLPTPPDRIAWREDLDPKIAAVRRLAVEFDAICIPMDGLFAAAAVDRPAEDWLRDGVHPTPAGHALIASAWLRAVGAGA